MHTLMAILRRYKFGEGNRKESLSLPEHRLILMHLLLKMQDPVAIRRTHEEDAPNSKRSVRKPRLPRDTIQSHFASLQQPAGASPLK